MKYLNHIDVFSELNESTFVSKSTELKNHLKSKPFDSEEVEEFISKFDSKEIKKFESYFLDHGVINLQNLRVLKTFFRHLINVELLEKITKSTEKTFKNMQELVEMAETGALQSDKTNIKEFKEALQNRDEILKRLEQIQKRISRYQEDL